MNSLPAPPPCLLCDRSQLKSVREFSGREIMILYRALGYEMPAEIFEPMRETDPVIEYECNACGFRFFDPRFAGSGQFYEALESSGYYVTVRPEFEFALKHLGSSNAIRSVMDVGCGDGGFLDLAAKRTLKTYGAELNNSAAERARMKGHTIFSKPISELISQDFDGPLDAITMFHVLEHVQDPLLFIRQACALLRPGGLLVIAVPKEDGLFRVHPYDPKNLPPHHISRWRHKDLRLLAERCSLRCEKLTGDPLDGRTLRDFWLQHNSLAKAIGAKPRIGGSRFAELFCLLFRKLGVRHFLPRWGLSSYGVFLKQ